MNNVFPLIPCYSFSCTRACTVCHNFSKRNYELYILAQGPCSVDNGGCPNACVESEDVTGTALEPHCQCETGLLPQNDKCAGEC